MEVSSPEKKSTEKVINPLSKSSNISELLRVAKAPNLNIDISKLSTQGLLLEKAKKLQEMKKEIAVQKKPIKTETDETRNKEEILKNQTGICKIANKFNILNSKIPANIEVLRKFSLRLSNKKIFKKNEEEEKEKNISEKENIIKEDNVNYQEKEKNNLIKKISNNNIDEEEKIPEIKISNTVNGNHHKLYNNTIIAILNNNNKKYKKRQIKLADLEKPNNIYNKILDDEFKKENEEKEEKENLEFGHYPSSTKELINLLEEKTTNKNNFKDENFNDEDEKLNISGVSWDSNEELNSEEECCGEIYPEEIFNKDEILGKAESEIFNFEEENHENEKSPLFAIEYETIKDNYSIKQCNTVLEYSFREDQNINSQILMEDKSKSIENFNNNKNQMLFAIFDGFGGDEISNFLQNNFTQIYKQFLEETKNNIPKSLIKSFKEADNEIKHILNVEGKSSTATIVHIIWENSNKLMVYTANVGNTRVSLISPKHIIKLSQEQITPEIMHKKNIKNIADYIKKNKVSKVFGNYIFELDNNNQKIEENLEDDDARTCCIPFISKIQIDLKIKNQFIFLGSNGVWDKINEKDIQQLVKNNNNSEQLCAIITKNVLYKDSPDNISVFSIRLT